MIVIALMCLTGLLTCFYLVYQMCIVKQEYEKMKARRLEFLEKSGRLWIAWAEELRRRETFKDN